MKTWNGAQNISGNKHTVALCDFQKKKVFFICDFKNKARQQKFLPQKLKKNLRKKFWVELQHQSVRKNFLGYTPVKVTNVELISQSLISSGTQSELQKQQHICCCFFFNRKVYFNLAKKRRPMLFWELHRSINLWARFFFHRGKFFLFCFDCLHWPGTVHLKRWCSKSCPEKETEFTNCFSNPVQTWSNWKFNQTINPFSWRMIKRNLDQWEGGQFISMFVFFKLREQSKMKVLSTEIEDVVSFTFWLIYSKMENIKLNATKFRHNKYETFFYSSSSNSNVA